MGLWFISRHGEAEQVASDDFNRQLTEAGKIGISQLWQQIREVEAELPTAILVSPYIRAQETATLIATALGITNIETTELLVPEASVSALLEDLSQRKNLQERYLLVSHMPFVGYLCSQWCKGIGAPAANFHVGQVVAITGEPSLGSGKPLWKRTP